MDTNKPLVQDEFKKVSDIPDLLLYHSKSCYLNVTRRFKEIDAVINLTISFLDVIEPFRTIQGRFPIAHSSLPLMAHMGVVRRAQAFMSDVPKTVVMTND